MHSSGSRPPLHARNRSHARPRLSGPTETQRGVWRYSGTRPAYGVSQITRVGGAHAPIPASMARSPPLGELPPDYTPPARAAAPQVSRDKAENRKTGTESRDPRFVTQTSTRCGVFNCCVLLSALERRVCPSVSPLHLNSESECLWVYLCVHLKTGVYVNLTLGKWFYAFLGCVGVQEEGMDFFNSMCLCRSSLSCIQTPKNRGRA